VRSALGRCGGMLPGSIGRFGWWRLGGGCFSTCESPGQPQPACSPAIDRGCSPPPCCAATYDLSDESYEKALDALLDNPDFLSTVEDEVRM